MAPPTAYSQLRELDMEVSFVRVRDRMALRPSPGRTPSAASEISSDSRASWCGSSRGSSATGCLPRCGQVVGEGVAQRGGAAGRVALHGAPADAERLGDLGLGEVHV